MAMSAVDACWANKARFVSRDNIHPSRFRDGRSQTRVWYPASMKSGPHLNG
jgi:hypothetical protein